MYYPIRDIIEQTPTHLDSKEQFNYLLKNIPWNDEQLQVDFFVKALDDIAESKKDKPLMIELGSGGIDGSYYSLLFEKYFNYNCDIINTEPRKYLIDWAKEKWNGKHLINTKFYICYHGVLMDNCSIAEGQSFDKDNIPCLKIKTIWEENNVDKVDMLHCDIQQAEIEVLQELLEEDLLKKIHYYFISTHAYHNVWSYYPCLETLTKNLNAKVHFSDPHKGGSADGLIVVENLDF